MKAAVFQGVGRPHVIAEVDDPAPGAHDLIVAVERCGVCGTDLHATAHHDDLHPSMRGFVSRYGPGTILGHEFSGRVVATGGEVRRFSIGDRIVSMGVAGCGRCASCLSGAPIWCAQKRIIQGGFAEYALASEFSALQVPDALSSAEGALIEPLACSHHAVDMAGLRPGARVLILGAGVIGLGVALFARRSGAGPIVVAARSRERAFLAEAMGASALVTQGMECHEAVVAALGGSPDCIFECVGVPGLIDQAIALAAPRSTIVVCGLCLAPDRIAPASAVFKELRIQFSIAYRMADFKAVSDLMCAAPGQALKLVTCEIGLGEFPEMFEALRGPSRQCKVLVAPNESPLTRSGPGRPQPG